MTHSMTAYASRSGAFGNTHWDWDMRGVNARGLDLRLRLPDGLGALEGPLKKSASATLTRGAITVSLRLSTDAAASTAQIDCTALDSTLHALRQVQTAAAQAGVSLTPPSATDILAQRGVMAGTEAAPQDDPALTTALSTDFDELLCSFVRMRKSEGDALQSVITTQLDQIASLTKAAHRAADARQTDVAQTFSQNIKRILAETTEADPYRLAQELAILAVKSDVTEEIDRLAAHVQAARDLMAHSGSKGRKLDFLAQEFNREANTLCAKSGDPALTRIGLDLKAVIDQMREQIQNVE